MGSTRAQVLKYMKEKASSDKEPGKSSDKSTANRQTNASRPTAPSDGRSLPPCDPLTKIQAYYDTGRGGFWTQNTRGEWIPFSESSLRRMLKLTHFPHLLEKEALMKRVDQALLELQTTADVAYAGPIAGYQSGFHEICGQRVLVTSGPNLLKAKQGTWPNFRAFVEQLLGDEVRIFYGWIKAALRSLYSGPPWVPGQMLAVAGPAGCGKSLLQNLVTELLGNRSAKPYRYMIGDTDFNFDLVSNEHLMIEDEAASTDLRVRRHFGSQLKNMMANEVQRLRRMRLDALSVTPFWRITISVNDEPENLAVLPPIDESLKDKITLLRAYPITPPFEADDIKARNAWRAKLSAELPAFMFWLRSYRVPAAMVNVRYGVSAFQNAELVEALQDLSPERRLMTLIDGLQIWDVDGNPWEGTANELEERLLEKDRLGRVAKLLYFSSACGTYLGRLASQIPDRISKAKLPGVSTKWKIDPPARG